MDKTTVFITILDYVDIENKQKYKKYIGIIAPICRKKER